MRRMVALTRPPGTLISAVKSVGLGRLVDDRWVVAVVVVELMFPS